MKKKPTVIEELIVPFKYSQKVTLHPGDDFHCSCGPYWIGKDGKKINMGQKGAFTFVNSIKDGIIATNGKMTAFIYMGETKTSETTGTCLAAHKLKKRKK
jgi:hypothetical protein